jgi:hypothetical protein
LEAFLGPKASLLLVNVLRIILCSNDDLI